MNQNKKLFSVVMILFVGASTWVQADEWGDLTVQFVFDGPIPVANPVAITKDAAFCSKTKLVDDSLVIDEASKGVGNVIAYLYLSRGASKPPIHPDNKEVKALELNLDNDKCRFDPHVVCVQAGQELIIGNLDSVGHNTKIDTFANDAININLPAGSKLSQLWEKSEKRPSQISCSIHPWMKAWVVIKDHPYFGASNKQGEIVIKNVPSGKWTFQFWQEAAGYVDDVNVDGKDTKWKKGRVEINMTSQGVDLGVVKVNAELFK